MEELNRINNDRKNFALRLIGRLIFCWFLKAKGWIGNDILDFQNVSQNYYHDVLEALFFDTLNKPADQRTSSIETQLTKVPYLNGGLFEAKTGDYYNSEQKSHSDRINWQLDVPDSNLKSILELFGQYYFTIDENTSTDQEVGIDPEMMGRIFENFILERSSTGSFYTPREIVDYMVESSLIESLKTQSAFQTLDQTQEQVMQWITMNMHELQKTITLKPNQKVVLDNHQLGRIAISAYLIAKLRGQLYSSVKRNFVTCNSHSEITSQIWDRILANQFQITHKFIPNPNISNVKEYKFLAPKIGYILRINDQDFALFGTMMVNGQLLLDTIYGIYDKNKITKLTTKNSYKSLKLWKNSFGDNNNQFTKLLDLYFDHEKYQKNDQKKLARS